MKENIGEKGDTRFRKFCNTSWNSACDKCYSWL